MTLLRRWPILILLITLLAACSGDASNDSTSASANGSCIEQDPEVGYSVAYRVVNGELGDVCFGEPSSALEDSWDILARITPQEQRTDLSVFGGFDNADSDTYAFVTIADEVGEQFEMTVNISDSDRESNELLVTMAHEFAHVFTANTTQIDRETEADCDTYDGGEGCYYDDAIMTEWVQRFWDDHIDDFDPDANNEDAGGQRCDLDSGFFGSYGATNPEEDFAEAFGAYVMQIPAETDAQQERLDWINDQAGLRTFRDLAADAGYGPLPSNFDPCG